MSWYQFKNLATDHAEITLRGIIGVPKIYADYGLDAGGSVTDFDRELKSLGDVKNITLRIFTQGGYIYDAMAIHDILKAHPANITAQIDGLAASAGSWLMLAADRVEMPSNAWLMIHNVQGFEAGDHRHMAKVSRDLERFSNDVAKMYERKIKATKGEANIAELRTMMDDETWMSGEEALNLGLIDALTDAVEFTNLASSQTPPLFNLARVPAAVKALLFDTSPEDMAKKNITPPAKKAPNFKKASNAAKPPKNEGADPEKDEEEDPENEEEEDDKKPDNEGDDTDPKKEDENPENEDEDTEEDEELEADPSNLAKLITSAVNKAVAPLRKEVNQLKKLRGQGIDPSNLEGADTGVTNPKKTEGKKEMPKNLTPLQRISWARQNKA